MKDEKKTKNMLIGELKALREQLAVSGKLLVQSEDDPIDPKTIMASILDAIPHAVVGLKDRKIFFANDAVETVFGWRPEELIGGSIRVFYRSDEEYREIAERFYPFLEKDRTHSEEFPCRHRDGRDIICWVSTSRIGELLRERMIIATYQDITVRKQAEEDLKKYGDHLEELVNERAKELVETNERLQHEITQHKRDEEALRESEDKFRVLTEKAAVGVYLIQDMRFQYINPKCADIWGYTVEDLLKQKLENLIAPEDLLRVGENLFKRISGEIDFLQSEFKAIRKNGDIFHMEAYGSRIIYKGRPAIMGTLIDISERKYAEEEKRRREKLQGGLEMAGTICHEMNQPMQIVSGYSDLLLKSSSEQDPIRPKLDTINLHIKKMAEITRKLMLLRDYETQDYLGFSQIINIHKDSGEDS